MLLRNGDELEILAFQHPLAGFQLVKGTIEQGEKPAEAAVRELTEESGILGAEVTFNLGIWQSGYQGQVWSFHLCGVNQRIPNEWVHHTTDGGGHDFRFFWHPIAKPTNSEWHEVFKGALSFIREALTSCPSVSSIPTLDEYFMHLALLEGRKALPACLPNPPVGCVLVRDGNVVASGFTQHPGQHHAEAMALSNVAGDLSDVTAYVTLEPCSFHGRTPSCAETLVNSGIKRVVVATLDPDPRNSGAGVEILKRAGVEVTMGILEKRVLEDIVAYLAT